MKFMKRKASMPTHGGLLSMKMDFVFRYIFGSQKNAEVVALFLQAALRLPDDELVGLTIGDPHLLRRRRRDKLGIVDVKVRTASGKTIHVEMQVAKKESFDKRIVYYNSGLYYTQIGRGDDYRKLQRVVSIAIVDFDFVMDSAAYHNRYRLYDNETGSLLTDVIEVNVLELRKLPGDDDTRLWEWLRFMNTREESEMAELAERNSGIKKAYDILREMSENSWLRQRAELKEKERRDRVAEMDYAITEGRAEGLAEGNRKIAAKMKAKGIVISEISEITGLSADEVKNLP
jgi:predicted transposase/invertase (TIGR01784 family)